jgi:hypothetical protein
MPDLERELRDLGAALELPPTPDLVPAVRARVEAAPPPPRLLARRTLVLAFALVAVAVGAVMAVPQARTAVLEWLGLRGVAIERVETPPTATRSLDDADALGLGERVTLEEARRSAGHALVVPTRLGAPDGVYVEPGGRVSLVYLDGAGEVTILLTQFRAAIDERFVRKAVGPGTRVEPVTIGTSRGWWIEGEPHEIVLLRDEEPVFETLRLATNTLLWERGAVTLRLEGDFGRAEAVRLAESASPR